MTEQRSLSEHMDWNLRLVWVRLAVRTGKDWRQQVEIVEQVWH